MMNIKKERLIRYSVIIVILLISLIYTSDYGYCWGNRSQISSSGFNSTGVSYQWDHSQNAFVCYNNDYGNYLRECSSTRYERIGNALPEDEDYMSGSVSTSDVVSFDLRQNSGEVGLRIYNLKYSHPDKGEIYIDSDIVITDYADGPDGRREKTESVAFYKYSRPIIWMSGVYALWIDQRFYYSGTRTPITIASNTTIVDVDDYQGVIFKSSNAHTGVGNSTDLRKNNSYSGTGFPGYYGGFGSVSNTPRPETSVAYNFRTNECNIVYFDNSPSYATAGGNAINETTSEETGTKLNKKWHSYSSYNNWMYSASVGNPIIYTGPKNFIRSYILDEYSDRDGTRTKEVRNVYEAKYKRFVKKGYTSAWLTFEYRYFIRQKDKVEERRWDNVALFSARNTYVPRNINHNPIVKNMKKNPGTETYEGDNIRVSAEFEDIDEVDLITSWYRLRKDGQIIEEGKEINHNNNKGVHEFNSPAAQGGYQVEWFVKDQNGGTGTGIFNYVINAKGDIVYPDPTPDPNPNPKPDPDPTPTPDDSNIKVHIYHTDKWEQKRNVFNIFYYGESTNAKTNVEYINLDMLPRKRYKNVFWSGEKILVQVTDTKSIESIDLYLTDKYGNYYRNENGIKYRGILQCDGVNTYRGSIWDKDFYTRKNNDKPNVVNVEIHIKFIDGEVKVLKEPIFMDDYREYSQPHLQYV